MDSLIDFRLDAAPLRVRTHAWLGTPDQLLRFAIAGVILAFGLIFLADAAGISFAALPGLR